MKLIPLTLYQPETLFFRVDDYDALCLPIVPGVALFKDEAHHPRVEHFYNSMHQSAYAFYLSNDELLIGPVVNSKKASFFRCQINTSQPSGIEILEFIGGVSNEEYYGMKMLGMAGVKLQSIKEMTFPMVSFKNVYFILEEKKHYNIDLREHGIFNLRLTTLKRAIKRGHVDLPTRIVEVNEAQPNAQMFSYTPFRHKGEKLVLVKGEPWLALRVRNTDEAKDVLSLAFIDQPYVDDPFCLGLQLAILKVFSDKACLCGNAKDEALYLSALEQIETMGDITAYLTDRNPNNVIEPPKTTSKSVAKSVPEPIIQMTSDTGMAISVAVKTVSKPSKKKKSGVPAKAEAPNKPSSTSQKLKIHSYSSLEDSGCRVDVKWSYGEAGELLRYWVPSQAVEDLQIVSELMAIRDVLLVKTIAAGVPISVGAEDLDMIVSKGAIKRMIRSDSTKLRNGWESARYLMARCFGGKIEVEKELPFVSEKSPAIEFLSLESPVEAEMVDSPLGPVRMSHHAIKRVMERREKCEMNTWAFTLDALATAEIKGKANSFKQVKHEKEAQYLVSSGWRFVVGEEQGGAVGRLVFTAYPKLEREVA